MAKFNPNRRQATLGISKAIYALAKAVLIKAMKNKNLRHNAEVFSSYPNRGPQSGSISLDGRVAMISSILTALGREGRKTLAKQERDPGQWPIELISNTEDYWSVVFDFAMPAPESLGGNIVRSLIIHGSNKEQTTAYDVSVTKSRYADVVSRDRDTTKNLTTEQCLKIYALYVPLAGYWLHYDHVESDVGHRDYSLVTVLASLDIASIQGLIDHINRSIPESTDRYHLTVGENRMFGRRDFDDSPDWVLVHTTPTNVEYVVAFEEYLELTSVAWSKRQATRYRIMAEWEDYVLRNKELVQKANDEEM